MAILRVPDLVMHLIIVRELYAAKVVVEVVEDVLLLVIGKPVSGVLAYPVVGTVVRVGGVVGVDALGPNSGWLMIRVSVVIYEYAYRPPCDIGSNCETRRFLLGSSSQSELPQKETYSGIRILVQAMTTAKVFVSSVMRGMEKDRAAVERALNDLSVQAIRFEVFPAHPASAMDRCLQEIEDSEVFIQIIGDSISRPAVLEYEKAFEHNRDSIIIFVRDCGRSSSAQEYVEKLRNRHTYRTYAKFEELYEQVKVAVQSLTTDALRALRMKTSSVENEGPEFLFNDKVTLNTHEWWRLEFEAEEGDRIKGIVEGTDNFDVYLFSESQYAEWRSGEEYEPDAHEVRAYAIDTVIPYDDTWYLVVYMLAWFAPIDVRIKLRKID